MDDHAWALIQRNGDALTGEDDFPSELAKLNAKTFILRLPGLIDGMPTGLSADMEFEVPEGFGLVFKRRNRITSSDNGGEPIKSWKYVLSIQPLKQEGF